MYRYTSDALYSTAAAELVDTLINNVLAIAGNLGGAVQVEYS
jgi:hypothetical protein